MRNVRGRRRCSSNVTGSADGLMTSGSARLIGQAQGIGGSATSGTILRVELPLR